MSSKLALLQSAVEETSAFSVADIAHNIPVLFNTSRGARIIEDYACHHGKLILKYSQDLDQKMIERLEKMPIDYRMVTVADIQFCIAPFVPNAAKSRSVYEFLLDPQVDLGIKGKIAIALATDLITIK